MRTHIRILAILHLVAGVIVGAGSLFFMLTMAGIGSVPGFLAGGPVGAIGGAAAFGAIGFMFSFLTLTWSLAHLAAGYGLLSCRSWARVLAIVSCLFHVLTFPIGTIFTAYTLWVLLSEKGQAVFSDSIREYEYIHY